VYAVSFEEPGRVRAYIHAHRIAVPVLADPERRVYRAYGLGRGPWWRMYGPRVLWGYLRRIPRGARVHLHGDTLQRGGDFVIAPDGSVLLAHVGRDPFDRPPVDALLGAVRGGAGDRAASPTERTGGG
jgi:hypothetical protein